ncbi:unnamed protein product [Brassica oleracea var. botrytis]
MEFFPGDMFRIGGRNLVVERESISISPGLVIPLSFKPSGFVVLVDLYGCSESGSRESLWPETTRHA